KLAFGVIDPGLFLYGSAIYLMAGFAFVVPMALRQPDFNVQLSVQVCLDIASLVVLMHASGGIQSGIGLLLLIPLAASGLIKQGRMMLFFAAIASISVLLEHTYDHFYLGTGSAQYAQAGMLCIGYFATGWLMRVLAQSSRENVELARKRGADLASLERINHRVIQELHEGILVVDNSGRILSWNLQAESLLGIPGEKMVDAKLESLVPQVAKLWQSRKEQEGPMETLENGLKIRVRFLPVDGRNSVIFLEDWGSIQDQARQIKLAALGRLTANIAHEIRNPLSSISYAAELLLEDARDDEIPSRLLHIILENSKRLDNMVQDILRFNRKDRANPETFSPESFFAPFLEQFCQIHRVPRESFELEMSAGRDIVFDKSHLNQVMWNLCRNAWHHSRKLKGSIRLEVDADKPDWVKVDIIDDGPGIPETLQAQLFEPFFTTSEGGTGLGLYIAREISGINGARLDYVDDRVGGHFRLRCRGTLVD
ncbi:MAG TPA: ATP-binding protein, partial [Burkholderiales bacterium]|nr:ATP-binding protein [Burkholderiales bacterium]